MDPQKLELKSYLTPESARLLDAETPIPVLHQWIKQRARPELMIDVASYQPVPQGPGVVLIGHGADYVFDEGEGRPGLLHNRKRAGLAVRDQRAAVPRERPARGAEHGRDAGGAAARARSPGAHAVHGPIRSEMRGGAQERFAVAITNGTSAPLATLLERAGGPPGADASLMA
jgi:hypothetical protein